MVCVVWFDLLGTACEVWLVCLVWFGLLGTAWCSLFGLFGLVCLVLPVQSGWSVWFDLACLVLCGAVCLVWFDLLGTACAVWLACLV